MKKRKKIIAIVISEFFLIFIAIIIVMKILNLEIEIRDMICVAIIAMLLSYTTLYFIDNVIKYKENYLEDIIEIPNNLDILFIDNTSIERSIVGEKIKSVAILVTGEKKILIDAYKISMDPVIIKAIINQELESEYGFYGIYIIKKGKNYKIEKSKKRIKQIFEKYDK